MKKSSKTSKRVASLCDQNDMKIKFSDLQQLTSIETDNQKQEGIFFDNFLQFLIVRKCKVDLPLPFSFLWISVSVSWVTIESHDFRVDSFSWIS